ncbi:glycosyltransferase family 2 protein [Collinsella bouchesdurhonensis]|uniref:glycosyltransferase family 2 protein n=1 Tax=Collinsella bouchesdurhonensis TaxID=1907654 RepID=UPI003F8AF8C1
MRDKVLAIIPAYNEEGSLQNTIEELKAVAPEVDFIVINDGSTDSTGGICRANGYPVLDLPVNGGLTVGFQTGMKYAARKGYGYAIQFDADGQHMPRYIDAMRKKMDDTDADIVIGSRFVQFKKEHSARMFGSRIITFIVKMTTGKRVSDPTSGMRMFNRRMIELFAKDMSLNPEPETIAHLIRKGVMVEEVQVSMRDRTAGESYLNLTRSAAYMIRVCTSILFVQWFR